MQDSVPGSHKVVAIDYAVMLIQYVKNQGFNTEKLLDDTGISKGLLKDKQAYLSIDQYDALLSNAQLSLNDPVLGLRVGQLQHIGAHGALSYAMMSSKNLDAAMHQVSRFIKIRSNLTEIEYLQDNGCTVVRIDINLPQGKLYQFIIEQAFASFINIIKNFVGDSSFAGKTSFVYDEPEQSHIYTEIFNNKPRFSADFNEIRLEGQLLKEVDLDNNPIFATMAEKQCQQILDKVATEDSFITEVYTIITNSISSGRVGNNINDHTSDDQGKFPTQTEVAKQLNLSNRSLVRQLAELDTSFSEILQTSKFEMAKHYLLNTLWTLEEIGYLLDYKNPGNFSRSFKKWSDLSPSAYRKKHGSKQNETEKNIGGA